MSILLVIRYSLIIYSSFFNQSGNSTELIKPLFLSFWSFAIIFILCEFGGSLTCQYDEWIDIIYQSDWNTYPSDIQRMLSTVILAAQEPIVLQAFGNLSCTRESSKKVNCLVIVHIVLNNNNIIDFGV